MSFMMIEMAESTMPMRSTVGWKIRLKSWVDPERIRQHEDKVLLVLTLVLGVVVGLVVVAFILLTENLASRMYPSGGAAWRRVLLPILGALSTGFLLERYFPNARGSGIPQTKTALFINNGIIRLRTALGKFGCSAVSLASGIALGREGPSVQVGAGIASVLGRHLGLSQSRVKALVPIASAAALAAAFNTPIAAVLFTLEEIMGDLHAPVLGSIVLSSATSWITLRLVLGDEPLFHVPPYQLVHPVEFLVYALLGVIGGLVSVCFVKLLLWQRKYFLRMPKWSEWLQPVGGGLVVGLFGWFVPDVLGVGYGHVGEALNRQMGLRLMVLLVILKLLATATCYASGNSGGIFGPSLFIGAMMGGAVGGGAHYLLPDYTGSVGAYALVGMGTAFAGIIRVPLTSVIMIFEVTRDYAIIVPLMISNLISFFISYRLQREAIYEALLHQDGIDLPQGRGSAQDVLRVEEAIQTPTGVLSADLRIADFASAVVDYDHTAWPVLRDNVLLGMVSRSELEKAMEQGLGNKVVAEILPAPDPTAPLTAKNFPHVHADQSLDTALTRMAQSNLKVLPVVSRANVRKMIGIISLNDILQAYGLEERKSRAATPVPEEPSSVAAALTGALAALVGLCIVIGFLTHFYRVESRAKAQEFFQEGNKLAQGGQDQEAIEKYRNALSISHSSEHRLALALLLIKVGNLDEASIYLQELLKDNPTSGIVNVGLARVAAAQGRTQEAVNYYHRGIFGTWPAQSEDSRIQAWFELVDVLAKSGAKKQASTELQALLDRVPNDLEAKKRIGRLLLENGAPKESADVFRDILHQQRRDAAPYAGLGEAEFAQGDYFAAQEAFGNALRLNPADERSRDRLKLCEQIVATDPTIRGLNSAERYRRSERLVEETLGVLEQCMASHGDAATADSVRELLDSAHQSIARRQRPPFYADAAERNNSLAEQLWTTREKVCGAASGANEPLERVLSHISR